MNFRVFLFLIVSSSLLYSCAGHNFNKAVEYQKYGEYDKAIEYYQKAIKAGKYISLSEKNSGDIYFFKNNFPKAFDHYKHSIETDPDLDLDRIIKFISYSDKNVRSIAMKMLATVKNDRAKEKIISTISNMLKSDKQYEKIDALEFSAKLGDSCKPIIKDIVVLLDDPSFVIRQNTLDVLPSMANSAVEAGALEKIKQILKEEDDLVKIAAIQCIGNMEQYGAEFLPDLIELTVAQKNVRRPTYVAIRKIGVPSKDQAKALISYLTPEKPVRERILVLALFAKMKEEANEFVPNIIILLNDSDSKIIQRARETLAKIGTASEKSVPDLILLLNDKNTEVVLTTITELADIGPEASAAIKPLEKLLNSKDKTIKKYAENALEQIQQK